MAYLQYDNIDLSDIFISREQQLAQFHTILKAWKEIIVSKTSQAPNAPPSLRNKIRGLVVLIYGRGGFGKTTLLERYHQLALKQAAWVPKNRIIDWEFAAQDERHIFKCPPGEKVDAIEYFKLLRKRLAEALGKSESDFKEYIKAVRAVNEVQNRVNEVVHTIAKNEDMSWMGRLAGEGTVHLIRFIGNAIPAPFLGTLINSVLSNKTIEDAIKKGTGAGAQIGIEQLEKARETLLNKLRPHLEDYRECIARLGSTLGSDLASIAKKQPLLIFFDTYEEIDEADEYLKLVMGAAGTRVGWVIAGRDNLWAGSGQQTRWPVPTIEYGYKDLVWSDRQLAIDFESEGVGDFTIGDILEYFHQLCQKPRQPQLPPVDESEAERILEITQGIPLAVQITAGLYFKTANIESITSKEETDARREIIAQVVRRYLLHTRGDLKESARIYGLALLRPDSSTEAKAAALDLPDIDEVTSTLSWMQRRYSFIFAKKERPTLHQEVRDFLRQWLLEEEHRILPEVIKVNQRIYNAHLATLKKLEEKSPPYSQLSERLEEDKWVNAYLNVVEQQFWLDPDEGVRLALPFLLAASIYNNKKTEEIAQTGYDFQVAMREPFSKWWEWARNGLVPYFLPKTNDGATKRPGQNWSSPLWQSPYLTNSYSYLKETETGSRTTQNAGQNWLSSSWRNPDFTDPYPSREKIVEGLEKLAQLAVQGKIGFSQGLPHYRDELEALLWWNLGKAYSDTDENKAIEWYERALTRLEEEKRLKEETAKVYRSIAYAAYDEGGSEKYSQCIHQLSRVIDLTSEDALENAVAYYDRGTAYSLPDDNERAIADYDRAIALDPNYARSYDERGTVFALLKEYKKAIQDFNRAIELDPTNAKAYSSRGHIHMALQEYTEALANFEQAIKLNPAYGNAYSGKGRVHLYKRELTQATQNLEKALEVQSQFTPAALYNIWASMGKQLPDLAIADELESIASANPKRQASTICQGIALGLRGKPKEGLERLKQVDLRKDISVDFSSVHFWKCMLLAFSDPGHPEKAKEELDEALKENIPPVLLTPLYWLGNEQEPRRKIFFEQYAKLVLDKYGI